MKKNLLKAVMIGGMALMAGNLFAQEKTTTFYVGGNCGMCKKRIEQAANVEGVSKAEWNKENKVLTLVYDEKKTAPKTIQEKIAAVGHDAGVVKAADSTYSNLPGCCLYDRKESK